MKAFVRDILKFSVLTLVVYMAGLFLCGDWLPIRLRANLVKYEKNDFFAKSLEDVKNYKDVDILFLGSSHALRGFDTRIFSKHGYSSFNLGSSSQAPFQSLKIITKQLNGLHPKLVVLEVFPYKFEVNGYESDLKLIVNGFYNPFDYNDLKRILLTRNTLLINSFIFQIINFSPDHKQSNNNPNDNYVHGGFVETTRTYNYLKPIPYENHIWNVQKSQEDALDEIIKMLKEKNIKLILVQSPVRTECYNFLKNNDAIDRYFKSKATYYNFNKITPLNDTSYFYDTNHLKQKGVEVFDESFIKVCLKENPEIRSLLNR